MASSRERRLPPPAFRTENPFSMKVLQVFTGFGVGCGVGIGVGRPIYLESMRWWVSHFVKQLRHVMIGRPGLTAISSNSSCRAIPGLNQVMTATRGATDAFSGVTRHVNSALRKSGLKNIEAGIGCGVGIGHGFGIGIALKPQVIHGIQSTVGELMSKFTSRLKDTPTSSSAPNMAGSVPSNGQAPNGVSIDLKAKTAKSNFHHTSNEISQVQPAPGLQSLHGMQPEMITGSRTEKVVANFLQSPLFQDDTRMDIRDVAGNSHGMDNVLELLLKHQRVIDELRDENGKLRQMLIEELKVTPSKLQLDHKNGVTAYNPCSDCFECRRRSRKTRR